MFLYHTCVVCACSDQLPKLFVCIVLDFAYTNCLDQNWCYFFRLAFLSGLSLRARGWGFSSRMLGCIPSYFDIRPACWLHYNNSNSWLFFLAYPHLLKKLVTALPSPCFIVHTISLCSTAIHGDKLRDLSFLNYNFFKIFFHTYRYKCTWKQSRLSARKLWTNG